MDSSYQRWAWVTTYWRFSVIPRTTKCFGITIQSSSQRNTCNVDTKTSSHMLPVILNRSRPAFCMGSKLLLQRQLHALYISSALEDLQLAPCLYTHESGQGSSTLDATHLTANYVPLLTSLPARPALIQGMVTNHDLRIVTSTEARMCQSLDCQNPSVL